MLEEDGICFLENEGMLEHENKFYRKLFGEEQGEGLSLDNNFWEGGENVTLEENQWLEGDFSEEEIKIAIDSSYSEGAPGPDGFSFLYYQKFWPIIKDDFMAIVKEFQTGKANMARLNYVMIILIPKEEEAKSSKKFRPISLINYSFKVFVEALNTRLKRICNRLLAPNQTAFVKGRYILESAVAAHEIIHEAKRSGEKGLYIWSYD
jgi:hypothetical protein